MKGGIWVECPDCGDFWCEEHELHAFECPCPPVEAFEAAGLDPYSEGPWSLLPGQELEEPESE